MRSSWMSEPICTSSTAVAARSTASSLEVPRPAKAIDERGPQPLPGRGDRRRPRPAAATPRYGSSVVPIRCLHGLQAGREVGHAEARRSGRPGSRRASRPARTYAAARRPPRRSRRGAVPARGAARRRSSVRLHHVPDAAEGSPAEDERADRSRRPPPATAAADEHGAGAAVEAATGERARRAGGAAGRRRRARGASTRRAPPPGSPARRRPSRTRPLHLRREGVDDVAVAADDPPARRAPAGLRRHRGRPRSRGPRCWSAIRPSSGTAAAAHMGRSTLSPDR